MQWRIWEIIQEIKNVPTIAKEFNQRTFRNHSDNNLDQEKQSNGIVKKIQLINSTAAWCITCQTNEKTAFARDKVKEYLKDQNITYVKADWTNRNAQSLLDLEGIKYDDESLALIASSAQGSIRDGLTLLDQAIAHGNGVLESDQVKALLGTIDQSYIIELVNHVAASDGDGAYLALNKITELNVEYEQVLKIIISVFHKISLHQQLQDSEDSGIQQLADSIDPQIVQLHYEIALNALSKFHVHPHPKQAP